VRFGAGGQKIKIWALDLAEMNLRNQKQGIYASKIDLKALFRHFLLKVAVFVVFANNVRNR
jgi:chemotaxis methyl-accepting protein methylase